MATIMNHIEEKEVKRGKWVKLADSSQYICSSCERGTATIPPIGMVPIECPHCGAKMEIGGDE